jgi:hypothetical protein
MDSSGDPVSASGYSSYGLWARFYVSIPTSYVKMLYADPSANSYMPIS